MEQIKVKQIGKNLITSINGIKYTKVTKDATEVKSIKTKIELYNKRPDAQKLEKLLDIFDKTRKEKENKIIIKKGISKAIKKTKKAAKKVSKKSSSKNNIQETESLSLIEQLKNKLNNNQVSEKEKQEIRDLLKEQKEEQKKEIAAVVSSIPRKGEY
ncbi:MAG: hypothetical protein EKK61_03765 [Rickettsiales bacterium]|nr:MAG: hypothetical protein EKK61_03765 [Rickettsiales bacterium]